MNFKNPLITISRIAVFLIAILYSFCHDINIFLSHAQLPHQYLFQVLWFYVTSVSWYRWGTFLTMSNTFGTNLPYVIFKLSINLCVCFLITILPLYSLRPSNKSLVLSLMASIELQTKSFIQRNVKWAPYPISRPHCHGYGTKATE